jgi:hypothetical protein
LAVAELRQFLKLLSARAKLSQEPILVPEPCSMMHKSWQAERKDCLDC